MGKDQSSSYTVNQTNKQNGAPKLQVSSTTPINSDSDPNVEFVNSNQKNNYVGIISVLLICFVCFFGFACTKRINVAENPCQEADGVINGHHYVDLGLPSGVKWATCNLGAFNPKDYGCPMAWGDLDTKSEFDLTECETYEKEERWLVSNGYIGQDGNLTSSHDVARKVWGGTWRMPTRNEIEELIDNTTTEWTIHDGVKGRLVTSKINGKSIFLPAAGCYCLSWHNNAKQYGYYLSSTPYHDLVYHLVFDKDRFELQKWGGRYMGYSVRAVSE